MTKAQPDGLTNDERSDLMQIEADLAAAKALVADLSKRRHGIRARGRARLAKIPAYMLVADAKGRQRRVPEYYIWRGMIHRCESPNSANFKDYGGRGIEVCDRWRSSFEAFLEDMGRRPAGMSIDRYPDNDGNYEPGNCRWATRAEQSANRRNSSAAQVAVVRGEELPISVIASRAGVSSWAIRKRIASGWPADRLDVRANSRRN